MADLRSDRQAFLVGETVYLRPVELADAGSSAIWHQSPFPRPIEVVEEELRKRLEPEAIEEWDARMLLIACRRDSDRPVGSVEVASHEWRIGELTVVVDRLLPELVRQDYVAEIIDILAPWLLYERHMLSLYFSDAGVSPVVRSGVEKLGGRLAVQLRECLLVEGNRRDQVFYQIFNRDWVARLGAPPEPVFGGVERSVRSPARAPVTVSPESRPDGALVVGERLYLRPFEPDEAKLVAEWGMQETEVYYPEGRLLINAHVYGHVHKRAAEDEVPRYIGFAIVERATGQLIGANGLNIEAWTQRVAETETEIYRPEHRNAGYGTEAKQLLLEYAFERLGMHAVISWVAEINPRSAAALRKQGYRDAGLIAWDSLGDAGFCGNCGFDLLADEWREARESAR